MLFFQMYQENDFVIYFKFLIFKYNEKYIFKTIFWYQIHLANMLITKVL